MKVVVVSDTHKNFSGLKEIVESNSDAELFIHLGDGWYEFSDVMNLFPGKQFVYVRGNCDYGSFEAGEELVVPLGGFKAFVTHGHRYNVNTDTEPLVARAKSKGCEIALYGHTHIYKTEVRDGVYVMNPGSIETPRGRNSASYGVIEIDGQGKIEMKIVAFE
ncbi:metallophosphoesterase [Clostridia bacterium]|nr:metallophosphoesterase [Clostridia bacterium]